MKKGKSDFSILKETVIDKGLCTGCGTCVGVCPTQLIDLCYIDGEAEPYLAKPPCVNCKLCLEICPGKDIPILEMEKMTFGRARNLDIDEFGIYQKCFVAYAADENIRSSGASGGTVTALLAYALDKGIVDAVIVAGFNDRMPYRQEAKIVTESKELTRYARSKHGGPVPTNALLHQAVFDKGIPRLAIVGLPCHVHGIRKMQLLEKPREVADSTKLILGLFCGSQFYFEATRHLLMERCDVMSLDEVEIIDYRWGAWPGGFYVKTKDGKEVLIDRFDYTFNKFISYVRDRCMVCIDHGAELADISFGDYWYSGCKVGDLGWNIILVRTNLGMEILEDAANAGYVVIEEASTDQIARSGREVKRHTNPFRAKQRRRYRIPVPDFGFVLKHEPQIEPQHYTMPRAETRSLRSNLGENQGIESH